MSALLLLLVTACSGGPEPVEQADLTADEQAACTAFLDDLPEVVAGAVITCGVPEPATLEPTSECEEVRGVGWFVDADAMADPDAEATATAIGVRPRVAVVFAAEDRGDRSLEVLSALADPVSEHLERISRCQ